jgi:hypothetical protein
MLAVGTSKDYCFQISSKKKEFFQKYENMPLLWQFSSIFGSHCVNAKFDLL